jgi:D-alanine-D-alanine ligase
MNIHVPDQVERARRLRSLLDCVMQDASICVVHGGDPKAPGTVLHETFNPRATKSYRTVAEDIAQSLRRSGFRKVHVIADGLQLAAQIAAIDPQMVWVNSGGVQGYDAASHTPAMLEMLGVPYVGHDPLNVSLLDNKHVFKHLMRSLGIPTSPFVDWDGVAPLTSAGLRAVLGEAVAYVAKPVSGRASNHVMAADHLDEIVDAMRHIHDATQSHVLVEHYLPGAEYTVAVYGGVCVRNGRITISDSPTIFSPVERLLDAGERVFTSMDVKPITQARLRLLAMEDPVRANLADLARAVYEGLNLSTLVRLDVRADADGVCCVLEANPKPDLKAAENGAINIVSLGLAEIDMTYDDLILSVFSDTLLQYVTRRRRFAPGLSRFMKDRLT